MWKEVLAAILRTLTTTPLKSKQLESTQYVSARLGVANINPTTRVCSKRTCGRIGNWEMKV